MATAEFFMGELLEYIEQAFDCWCEENNVMQISTKENWPLDSRARPEYARASKHLFVVHKDNVRNLDYYGGFEYVEKENRSAIGDYVVFSGENDRVARVLSVLVEDEEEPEDQEDLS